MLLFDRNAIIIVVSDIHLGDIYCMLDKFELFLSELLQKIQFGNLPYFKTLIILGDFFDIIVNSFWKLCTNQKYIRIYELLQAINLNGIIIVFVLGNHEIYTTGLYNTYFNYRKKKFLKDMRENGFNFNLLSDINLCQYIILGKNKQNVLTMSLYDSIDSYPFVQNKKLFPSERYFEFSKNIAFNNNYYFLTHGYQFEDWDTHHFITAPWWIYIHWNK